VGKQTNRMLAEKHVMVLATLLGPNVAEARLFDNENYDAPEILAYRRDEDTGRFKRKYA